jgi:hypothetical protein
MGAQRSDRGSGGRLLAIGVSLLLILILGLGDWGEGQTPELQWAALRHRDRQLDIAVHHGRLSVHLWDADVGKVLAQIGQQAGIRILGDFGSEGRLSAQFEDLELEAGLRRLLRLASLNHMMLYAPGPLGGVALREVRVLRDPEQLPSTPEEPPATAMVAEHDVGQPTEGAGQHFVDALRSAGAFRQATAPGESEAAQRFREMLDQAQQTTSLPSVGEASELARRIREALQPTQQPGLDFPSPASFPQ